MCSRLERGLNENIRALLGALNIKEFVELSKRAQKMKAIQNEKKWAKTKNESSSKQSMSKNFLTPPLKKSGECRTQFVPPARNTSKSTFQ